LKKLLSLILVVGVASLLILSGCGTSGSKNGAPAQKTLHVVTDAEYAPFESMDKGQIVGFDVDFIKAVAKDAGYNVNIDNIGWDPLFAALQGKQADLGVSAITINSDREQTYDFSIPYFLSTNEIMEKQGSSIKGAADLKGKTIAVQNGTTGQAVVEKIIGKNNPKLKKFDNNNLAIMELINGGADAVVADNTVVDQYVKNNPDKKLTLVEDPTFPKEFYGIMFPKGSKLKPEFDKAIKKVFADGTYSKIYKKHFGTEPKLDKIEAQQNQSK
jgi:glutamine transport system substrate-binding protein